MLKSLFSFLIIFILSIQLSSAVDYYWVGGNGNWTDYGQHWAKTSGGNVFHTQVPGPLDNIYFDNASLSGRTIINLDQTIESCKDISVSITTDTLLFASTAVNPKLSIYGSTSLSPRFKIGSGIKLYFEASSGSQTFNQNRAILPCSLVFNNSGNWLITDSVNVFSLEILKGSFTASSKKIRSTYFTKIETAASINITNSIFYVYSMKITKNTDVVTGNKIYVIPIAQTYTDSRITLDGNPFAVDSIFSSNLYSFSFSGNAHIKYMRITNINYFTYTNYTSNGIIDRIDATNLSYISSMGAPSIGIFNTTNLKGLSISSGSLDITQFNLTSNSDCNNLLRISGYPDANLYKLNIHNNNSFILNYCNINNIDASSFPLKISNAVDGGGNTGVTFLSYAGEGTLYRIGDGTWSDITKWSLTSNGPPANCQPTMYTNVIFDAFSFTKPVNDISLGNNAVCKNFTVNNITPSVTFKGALKCYGDLISDSELKYDNTDIYLSATGGINKIKLTNGSGPNAGLDLNIIGTATYNFYSDIACGQFWLEKARINTNGFNMNIAYSVNLATGNFYGSTSSITTKTFYNYLTDNNDFASTRISASTFQTSYSDPVNYGTVILIGGLLRGSVDSCHIKHLKISGSVLISNLHSLRCDSLSIFKGIVVNMEYTNLTFDLFYNTGSNACGRYTRLKLTNSSFKSERNIIFDQFVLENVDATVSSFSYSAINSIDGSNNTGVIFSQAAAGKTFYWVKGTGKWSDVNHWSYTSGGPSANCIPARIDNVIFDANALTRVMDTVYIDNIFECKNLSLSNTPKVKFSGSLNVFGSFAADSNASFGSVSLLGNTAATVNPNKAFFESVTVNKNNTTTIVSNLTTYRMNAISGALRLIQATIDAYEFNATFTNKDSLLMRNSKIHSMGEFYLNIRNGLADCSSGIIETSVRTSSTQFSLISDSIRVDVGKVIMNYYPYDLQSKNSAVSFIISNIHIDSLTLENSLELLVDLELYNAQINTLQSYNENLRLSKNQDFDMSAQQERRDAQPANLNNIRNAQIASYVTGIVNMSFDHLKVYPGSTLQIFPNDTLYINKTLDVTGAPSYPIQISSPMNGIQGYIQNNGSVFGEYLFIQDNYVLNKPGYAGYNSSDVSNNMGWNFGVLYDTLLCSFNRIPCEKESVQLTVLSDHTLTNTTWKGPRGFSSTSTNPVLSNLSVANNGIYTFTSAQGKCMVDIAVFKNTPNKIVDGLNTTGVLSVEDYMSAPTWYLNNVILVNENSSSIIPVQTGYYKAATTSNRGCTYMSDSVYYISPSDPLFKPTLLSIQSNSQNDITITWTNVKNEFGYAVYVSTPFNPDFTLSGTESEDVLSSTYNAMGAPGDYCYYVKAFNMSGESSPSNTLCITISDIVVDPITVKPQLTYIGATPANDIEIRWNDVDGESDYSIFNKLPNQTAYSLAGTATGDATSFILPNTGAGEYCLYIQANLINTANTSLPSDPLCINASNPVSTGIANTKIFTGAIYPNPTTGSITISPSSKNVLYGISIETVQGENVFAKENLIGTNQLTLNLKQGIYLIKLHSDSFTICEKLIVNQ